MNPDYKQRVVRVPGPRGEPEFWLSMVDCAWGGCWIREHDAEDGPALNLDHYMEVDVDQAFGLAEDFGAAVSGWREPATRWRNAPWHSLLDMKQLIIRVPPLLSKNGLWATSASPEELKARSSLHWLAAAGNDVDGYFIRGYESEAGDWIHPPVMLTGCVQLADLCAIVSDMGIDPIGWHEPETPWRSAPPAMVIPEWPFYDPNFRDSHPTIVFLSAAERGGRANPPVVQLTVAEALSRVPRGKTTHTLRPFGDVLFGYDSPRDRIEEAIKSSFVIEESGPSAAESGHGLAIEDETGPLFIETKPLIQIAV